MYKWIDDREKEILNFITKQKPISTRIRRLIRENQELFPEAATHSRQLVMHILYTGCGNYICRYHQKYQSRYDCDSFAGENVVKGVAFVKRISKKNNTTDPQIGHMHCSCAIGDALMEFSFWKTWTATSTRPGFNHTEGMKNEVMPARTRAFVNQAFKKMTCLTLDDLYGDDYGTQQYEAHVCLKQAAHMLQKVNVNEEETLEIEELRWGIMHNEMVAGYLVHLARFGA